MLLRNIKGDGLILIFFPPRILFPKLNNNLTQSSQIVSWGTPGCHTTASLCSTIEYFKYSRETQWYSTSVGNLVRYQYKVDMVSTLDCYHLSNMSLQTWVFCGRYNNKQTLHEYLCGAGNEYDSVWSDPKVWEVVQHPVHPISKLLWELESRINFFSFNLYVLFLQMATKL